MNPDNPPKPPTGLLKYLINSRTAYLQGPLRLPLSYFLAVVIVLWGAAILVDPAVLGLPFDNPVVTDSTAIYVCGCAFHEKALRYLIYEHGRELNSLLYTFGNALIPLLVYRTGLCSRIEKAVGSRRYTKWMTVPLCVLLCLVFSFYYTSILSVIFNHAILDSLGYDHFNAARWFGDMYSPRVLTVWAYDGAYYLAECVLILWLRRMGFKTWFLYVWLIVGIAQALGWSAPSTRTRPTKLTASPAQILEINELEYKAGLNGIRFYDRVEIHAWLDAVTTQYRGRYRIYIEPTSLELLKPNELGAEIAHELGHVHYDHNRKDYILDYVYGLYIWTIIGVLLNKTFRDSKTSDGKPFEQSAQAIPIILLVILASNAVFMPLQSALGRCKERLADDYAVTLTGNACDTAALQAHMSWIEPYTEPLPIYEFLLGGHPTCRQRFNRAVLQDMHVSDLSSSEPNNPFTWIQDMRSN